MFTNTELTEKLKQFEAQAAALGCTVLPPEVRPDHPAFAALIAAVLRQKQPLTQEQIRDIIDSAGEEL